jgi:hypothetical protein
VLLQGPESHVNTAPQRVEEFAIKATIASLREAFLVPSCEETG